MRVPVRTTPSRKPAPRSVRKVHPIFLSNEAPATPVQPTAPQFGNQVNYYNGNQTAPASSQQSGSEVVKHIIQMIIWLVAIIGIVLLVAMMTGNTDTLINLVDNLFGRA